MDSLNSRFLKKPPSIQVDFGKSGKLSTMLPAQKSPPPSYMSPQPKTMKLKHYLELKSHQKRVYRSSANIRKGKDQASSNTNASDAQKISNPEENNQMVLVKSSIETEIKECMKSLQSTFSLFQKIKSVSDDKQAEAAQIGAMCQFYKKIKEDIHQKIKQTNQMLQKHQKKDQISFASSMIDFSFQEPKKEPQTPKRRKYRRAATTNQ